MIAPLIGHHAVIDWNARTITIDDQPVSWPVLIDGIHIEDPLPTLPDCRPHPGVLTLTVTADNITLDGMHLAIDDIAVPWWLAEDGPSVAWMRTRWAIELPILTATLIEHGHRPIQPSSNPDHIPVDEIL